MANLHASRRPSLWLPYTKPPPGDVSVDAAHPLAPAAYWAFNGAGILERVRGTYTASTATNFPAVTSRGVAQSMSLPVSGPRLANADLGITNQFTALCMARGASTNTGRQIFCRPFAATHTTPFQAFGMYVVSTSNNQFAVTNEAGTRAIPGTSVNLIDGLWHMSGGTWDGTTVTAWTDLTSGTAPLTGVSLYDQGQEILFGGNRSGASEAWVGDVLWLGIWNRVLSAAEIAQVYFKPYPFLIPGR